MTQSSPAGQTADLDATISALQGGLTSLPPEAAVSNLDSWQQQLQGIPGADPIASGLAELKVALVNGSASSQSVAELLTELGVQTASASENVTDSTIAGKLQQLGQMLTQAGSSLT